MSGTGILGLDLRIFLCMNTSLSLIPGAGEIAEKPSWKIIVKELHDYLTTGNMVVDLNQIYLQSCDSKEANRS